MYALVQSLFFEVTLDRQGNGRSLGIAHAKSPVCRRQRIRPVFTHEFAVLFQPGKQGIGALPSGKVTEQIRVLAFGTVAEAFIVRHYDQRLSLFYKPLGLSAFPGDRIKRRTFLPVKYSHMAGKKHPGHFAEAL